MVLRSIVLVHTACGYFVGADISFRRPSNVEYKKHVRFLKLLEQCTLQTAFSRDVFNMFWSHVQGLQRIVVFQEIPEAWCFPDRLHACILTR